MDERGLSVLHLAAVARVYGRHAKGVLRLLKQHPVRVIPVTTAWCRKTWSGRTAGQSPGVAATGGGQLCALNHHRGAFKAKNKRLGAPHFFVSECLDAALAQIVKAGGKEGKAGNWTEHQ